MSDPATRPTVRPLAARRLAAALLGVGALLLAVALSLGVGSKGLSLGEVMDGLWGAGGEAGSIMREQRVPRTIAGIVVGAALAVAGALIQAFTRNPLADPGILGVNSGAAFAIVVGVAFFGQTSPSGYIWFSFAGAIAATVLVVAIGAAGRRGPDPLRLTLAGVAMGAVLSGFTASISLLLPSVFDRLRYWGAGTLAGRDLDLIADVVPFVVVGLVLAVLVARPLNAVALGDDVAAALGARTTLARSGSIVAVTLLCGAATALTGPIAFVGLMVPHAVRWFVGPDQRWIVAVSLLAGPVLLLVADVTGRLVLPSGELPAGIVTAFIGAPVLIMLVRRRKVSGL
ncbi:iron chelate uptake ABC transporter family permease subunit [Nakamurella sp.]|uniref:iron chelate uptake ABC transporter family permease subunit n=1 Tax=Nakamurella sp. TaxID=1869182 RepID=UPI003B3BA667